MLHVKRLLPFPFLITAALAAALLVNGCAPPRVQVPPAQTPSAQTPAVQTPAAPPPPAQQSAADGLIKEGERLLASGAVERAGATLERAIRIAPRDPAAWYGLARVRFAQHRYDQAVELCRKALTLPTADPSLRRQCHELTTAAKAKRQ